MKDGIYAGTGVIRDGILITSGVCPMIAKMFALKDGTTELTCTLIQVIRESAKN